MVNDFPDLLPAWQMHQTEEEQDRKLSRRQFLLGMGAVGSGALLSTLPFEASSQDAFWSKPRVLDLYRPRTNERVRAVYHQNGALDPNGYRQFCNLLRDVQASLVVQMDPRLLDLLCAMQAWVAHYGYASPIHITSGYRSPQTNAGLEGAARNSMHMYGKAADIRFPGLPVTYLGKLAQRYSGGGVGFYISSNFVHVDTGRIRTWGRQR